MTASGTERLEQPSEQEAPDNRQAGEHQRQLQVLLERRLQAEKREDGDLRRNRDEQPIITWRAPR